MKTKMNTSQSYTVVFFFHTVDMYFCSCNCFCIANVSFPAGSRVCLLLSSLFLPVSACRVVSSLFSTSWALAAYLVQLLLISSLPLNIFTRLHWAPGCIVVLASQLTQGPSSSFHLSLFTHVFVLVRGFQCSRSAVCQLACLVQQTYLVVVIHYLPQSNPVL